MSRKALLKLAGYEVKYKKARAAAPAWFWIHRPTKTESPYYHISELHSWQNAWRHFNSHQNKE